MKNSFLILLLGLAAFSFSGCASIFTGTTQSVQVNSVPSGANVSVGGIDRGQTPLPMVLKKGSSGQSYRKQLSFWHREREMKPSL